MVDIKYRSSCDTCLRSKVKCSQTKPACSRCSQHGHQCIYSQYRKIGRPSHKTLAEQIKPKKPRLHRQSPVAVQPDDFSVQDSVLLDALPSLVPSDGTAASPEGFDLGTSTPLAWDSSASNSHNMPDPEQLDWTDLGNLLDFQSTALSPVGDAVSLSLSHDNAQLSPQNDLNDFARCSIPASPRAVSNTNQPRQLQPFVHRRRPSTPRDHLFHNRRRSIFSENALSTNHPPSPERRETSIIRPTSSRRSSFFSLFRPSEFPVHPSSFDTRCNLQCHASLTDQLAYITECQANNSDLALDTLLNLDDNIRTERDRILSCSACLEKSRRAQTLMLLTMVAGKLLGLFERDMSSRNSMTNNNKTFSPFPFTTRPLTIGDIKVDDAIKVALSLRLLRTYLERQLEIVAHLDHLRVEAEDRDVSFKVTGELLADVSKRAEYLLGIVAFVDGTGPVSISRVAVLDSDSRH